MDTLELSWNAPFSLPGVNTSYDVFVSDLSSPKGKTASIVIGQILEPRYVYLIPSRSSCSKYAFSIAARNDAGVGHWSQQLITSSPSGIYAESAYVYSCMIQ